MRYEMRKLRSREKRRPSPPRRRRAIDQLTYFLGVASPAGSGALRNEVRDAQVAKPRETTPFASAAASRQRPFLAFTRPRANRPARDPYLGPRRKAPRTLVERRLPGRGGVKVVSETPDTDTSPRPDSANSPYLCRIERVTGGARTRDLRSHNPPTPVATRCCTLQKRFI